MGEEPRNPGNAVFGLGSRPESVQAPPAAPGYTPPVMAAPAPSRNPFLIILVVALMLLAGVNLYMVLALKQAFQQASNKQGDELNLLTRRMDSSDERYAQLRARFDVTSEKLGMTQQELGRARKLAASIQEQQEQSVQQLNQAIAQKASAAEVNQLQADANSKFGGISNDITGLNKKIGETNDALTGAKGELSGAIAHTHDELVALAHRTDRDYFEFSLRRGAQQKVGDLSARLEKTNVKKNNYTVDLFFDDKRTVRKDQGLDSPVFFYVQGASSALEMVVNKVGKDSVSGYLSTPKGLYSNVANVLQKRPGT
jgi:uncharacterized protein (DUF305 family)